MVELRVENGGLPIREHTPQEWADIVDQAARYYLGLSGDEFRRAWAAGELDADDSDVLSVALLLAA